MKEDKLEHFAELDSLRTVAVILVLLAHYLIGLELPQVPYAWYGVDIFFTISGFLITSILIISLNRERNGKNKWPIIKNFIIRRAFRLFPAYYSLLIIFWVLKNHFNIYMWKDEFTSYFFTYTPNLLFYKIGLANGDNFPHLWSLGVEEQFYLLWPWLMLYPAARYRTYIILIAIVIALVTSFFFFDKPEVHLLPFSNFHTLGVGALLACFYTQQSNTIRWLMRYRIAIFFATGLNLLLALNLYKETSPVLHLYRELSLCTCTFSIVLVSIYGWPGVLRYFTRNKFVQYTGKISYGIYLFHMPVMGLYITALNVFHLSLPSYILLLLYFITTYILAVFSYNFIEMPFLRLKKRFEN